MKGYSTENQAAFLYSRGRFLSHRVSLLLFLLILSVPFNGGRVLYGIPPRIGIVAGESALQTSEAWSALVSFVEERFGILFRYEVFDGHRSLLKALKERWIDLGCIDVAWYVREQGWIRPLLRTEVRGQTAYRVVLIVQRNSIFYRTSDLRGFELYLKPPFEEMAGFYAPLAFLSSYLPVPIGSIRFLDTYESILKGVAYGKGMEVGAIPEYLWIQYRGSRVLESLRVLDTLPWIPTPVIVMRTSDEEARFTELIRILSTLSTMEQGKQILEGISCSGFTTDRIPNEAIMALSEQIQKVDMYYGPPK
ncbi:MAG: phosphate/phosphite/phosphonate ABC transporter substrate-binding protein [Spirochaetes bacterium]|nr:phosphate/phosphite/phosphonate ABC transporter substrate-binding protein [Spirochaetota bacterium]